MSRGYFSPDVGTRKSMNCDVCGCDMKVERNKYGYRSRPAAIMKKKSHYDCFVCPNREEEDWHNKCADLMDRKRSEISPSLQKIIQSDIDDILKNQDIQ